MEGEPQRTILLLIENTGPQSQIQNLKIYTYIITVFLNAVLLLFQSSICKLNYHIHAKAILLNQGKLFLELLSWEGKETGGQVPDGFPHIEAIQRLGALCAAPRQLHQGRQPVGNVDELPVLHAPPFQQGAGHKAHPSHASFPQAPLSSSKGPVIAPCQCLPTVIWNTIRS